MQNSKQLASALYALSKSPNNEEKTTAFFEYLSQNNQMSLLPQIKNRVIELSREEKEFETLFIRSAYSLSEQETENIKKIVEAEKSVAVISEVDKSLIASFSACYRGVIYDGSLKFTLLEMKKALEL